MLAVLWRINKIMKQLYIFDLDNTLSESRTPIDDDVSALLCRLLSTSFVAVISGESFTAFKIQLVSRLSCKENFERFFILPTSGGELWEYKDGDWKNVYSERIDDALRMKVISSISTLANIPNGREGDFIEDRGGQITYSALGINASIEAKTVYDPDRKKRRDFIEKIAPLFPELSFRIGGKSSVDATMGGVDKSFGIDRLLAYKTIFPQDAVFVGDALFEGGNDSAARKTGVDIVETSGPEETKKIIAGFLRE